MNLFRKVLIGVLGLALCHVGSEAQAGDGFPPNGAWAYGSRPFGQSQHWRPIRSVGWSNYGVGRFGVSGYSSFRYRSNSWYGSSLHVRYTNRVGYPFSSLGWCNSWSGYPSLYYSSYSIPSYPLYSCGLPYFYGRAAYSTHYVPSVMYYGLAPCATSSPSLYFDVRLPSISYDQADDQLADYSAYGAGQYAGPVVVSDQDAVEMQGIPYRVSKPSTEYVMLREAGLVPPMQLVSQSVEQPNVPEELLEAADNIFRAGGYREAARAYAQLTVKFGTSDLLCTRRFLAQMASGDLEQAVVVVSSAELAGSNLKRSTLPGGSLSGLGLTEDLISLRKEELAKHAYQLADDADSLIALARWLQLAGDEERAELFLVRARQLAEPTTSPEAKPEIM